MTLNVFLYNLPEDLVRIVRLKSPKTLEDALTVVLEEINFRNQYNSKNKNKDAKSADTFRKPFTTNSFQFGMRPQQSPSHTPQGFKVPFNTPQQQSNQRNPMNKPNFPQFGTNVGYRPNLFQNNNSANPQFGYRPNLSQNNNQTNPQFGYRPNLFQNKYQNNPQKPENTDVSMRTARNHNLEVYQNNNEIQPAWYEEYEYVERDESENECVEERIDNQENSEGKEPPSEEIENFHIMASPIMKPK